jgi:hypothetical protein
MIHKYFYRLPHSKTTKKHFIHIFVNVNQSDGLHNLNLLDSYLGEHLKQLVYIACSIEQLFQVALQTPKTLSEHVCLESCFVLDEESASKVCKSKKLS